LKEFSKRPASKGINPNNNANARASWNNSESTTSIQNIDKKVNDSFAAPRKLIEKTKEAAAY